MELAMQAQPEMPKIINRSQQDIDELLKRLRQTGLTPEDQDLLVGCVEFATWMPQALKEKDITIDNLRRILFGESNKKKKTRSKVSESAKDDSPVDVEEASDKISDEQASEIVEPTDSKNQQSIATDSKQDEKTPAKGHGRLGHSAYLDAIAVSIDIGHLKPGDDCPERCGGRLYALKPGNIIRITGNALATITNYKRERLRCALCGIVFIAELPENVCRQQKYDVKLKALLALQKYYVGTPFYRQEGVQRMLNFPLPNSTQFKLCEEVADCSYPVIGALETEAANGTLVHQDDTTARILSVILANKNNPGAKRTGMYTTGLISKIEEGHKIALFYTGTQHAGENLSCLLEKRLADKEKILQMCDALSANMPKSLSTIICNCLAHAFRKFRDLLDYYPEPCLHVMKELAKVYRNDEATVAMTDIQRLIYHRKYSKPVMLALNRWLKQQLKDKRVEPNSHLGRAINYMLKHWKKLRRFLTVPGAPIDNNVVEAALKIPIRVRKTAMFYKTQHGADISNILMSLIYTAKLCDENPVDYLQALQEHKSSVFANPLAWVPWRYRETLAQMGLILQEAA